MKKKRNSAQSLTNNFHAISHGQYDADRVKFYITTLRNITGRKEQVMITQMLDYAFENMPDFSPYREDIKLRWQAACLMEAEAAMDTEDTLAAVAGTSR